MATATSELIEPKTSPLRMIPLGAPCGSVAASSAHSARAATMPVTMRAAAPSVDVLSTVRLRVRTAMRASSRWVEGRLAGRILPDLVALAAVDLDVRPLLPVRRRLALVPVDLAGVDDRGVGVAVVPGAVRRRRPSQPRQRPRSRGDVRRSQDRAGRLQLVDERKQLVVVEHRALVDGDTRGLQRLGRLAVGILELRIAAELREAEEVALELLLVP